MRGCEGSDHRAQYCCKNGPRSRGEGEGRRGRVTLFDKSVHVNILGHSLRVSWRHRLPDKNVRQTRADSRLSRVHFMYASRDLKGVARDLSSGSRTPSRHRRDALTQRGREKSTDLTTAPELNVHVRGGPRNV